MSGPHDAGDRILARIREANRDRTEVAHPGAFRGWRRSPAPPPLDLFTSTFLAAGGDVQRAGDLAEATTWLRSFATEFGSITVGRGVPTSLVPDLPQAEASSARLALSAASGAIAETGSLILDSRDGRRTQMLAPTHVVFVDTTRIFPTLRDALIHLAGDLPAAIGLHSGPSKSADIGQVMVEGVHGPGRLVALLVGEIAGGG